MINFAVMCLFSLTGLLWHPESATGELALSDLRAGSSAKMSAVSQEGWGPEAHPQWNQVGPRQLCLMDPWGETWREDPRTDCLEVKIEVKMHWLFS